MKRCLLLSSLLFLTLVAAAANWLLPLQGRRQYSVSIEARGAVVTGLCMTKTDSTGTRGAIVNEFGIHALDFTLTADRSKVKLLNVMSQIDRWYIRRVVRRDLQFLFGATAGGERRRKRSVTVEPDGTVVMQNTKYNLKYSLKPIDEATE